MEIFMILNLQDNAGTSHMEVPIEFSNEITVKQVMEKIKSLWEIDEEHQELFYNGQQIINLDFSLQQIGIKNEDEIIVKHSNLQWWPQYRECVEMTINSNVNRMENAKEAVKLHERLMKSGLFYVYSSFNEFRLKNHYQAAAWVDGELDMMSKAVQSHFFIQHGQRGGTSEIDFHYSSWARSEYMRGTRNGILVSVQLHEEEHPTKYSVRCHHFRSKSFCQRASFPDIIEIFCYKFLELLGVGPAVQFILPSEWTGTKTVTYIATKWRDDFIRLSDLKKEEDINVEALVQLLLLKTLFFINDLHGDNCGQWNGTKTAAIVDSMPRAYCTYPDVKKILLGNHRMNWDDTPTDLLFVKCRQEKRLEIAKKWLQDWDLLSKIDKADALIRNEKDQMKNLGINFRGNEVLINIVTDDFNDYINAVKNNVKNLVSALGVNE